MDDATPEPETDGPETPTDGASIPPARWVRVTFGESGQILIDWAGIGPVEILGAAGYMEWQAKYLLDSEMAQRARSPRVVVPGDHLAPGGQRRGN